MATTTNFGWETPDDTDLVKDGALAMRTLGNSIDTSFVDLKGGTTGQNLRKASNTDLDFTWAGDATNTVIDAAGDLLYGSAADTLTRLPLGTAGQVLKVNSGATAPEWGAASGSAFVGVRATNTSGITCSGGGNTNLTFPSEDYDTDSFHSTTSSTQNFTIPTGKSGKYLLTTNIFWTSGNTTREVYLRKNSNPFHRYDCPVNVTNNQIIADVFNLTAGDVLFFEVYVPSTTTLNAVYTTWTYLGA